MSDYCFQPFLPDFYRTPSAKTLLFLEYYKTVYGLLSDKEKTLLSNRCRKGRAGYTLSEIFGIMMLKQIYGVPTIKATLQLLEDNQNLCTILNIEKIPSEATVSRLSKRIESVINISGLMERLITQYDFDMSRTIGHLSIDSTIVEAREKPMKINKSHPIGKRGRKKIGSEEQRQYLLRKAEEAICPLENPDVTLSKLEKRCSITAKNNSKGKLQWFIGYKVHLAVDDFGVPITYAVTGACVHDSQVAIPLIKKVKQVSDFYYTLMDKGYDSQKIRDFVSSLGKVAIIDNKAVRFRKALEMDKATAERFKARTTVERTNSELKDGFLPFKLYRKGEHARFDIELAVLLTTIKKIRHVMQMRTPDRLKQAA